MLSAFRNGTWADVQSYIKKGMVLMCSLKSIFIAKKEEKSLYAHNLLYILLLSLLIIVSKLKHLFMKSVQYKSSQLTYMRQNRLKTKAITRDKEGDYIALMGGVQQEDITLVNTYTSNIGAPKYIKKILEDF